MNRAEVNRRLKLTIIAIITLDTFFNLAKRTLCMYVPIRIHLIHSTVIITIYTYYIVNSFSAENRKNALLDITWTRKEVRK